MKRLTIMLAALLFTANLYAQKDLKMKMNAGIVTTRLAESKTFYTGILGFEVTFENEFYLLLHTPDKSSAISFLLPDHPSQQPIFHKAFKGQGMYLTIEVEDVDKLYSEIKKKGVDIRIAIRNEPWGDRHFAIEDPNGIGIDIVQFTPPEKK
ncbi:VOC family protein [Chitinophaga barathri]|nr:VOC family protein [Chitinophaga barathri]